MSPELKNKLQQSIDALLPIVEKEKLIDLRIGAFLPINCRCISQRIYHQSRCAKLGRLMALQTDSYTRYLIYNEFKRT